MEARYKERKQALLDECKIAPEVVKDFMPRLDAFLEPFIESMARQEQYDHASTYVKGLLSDLEQKNVESIAYRFGQERLGLQKFIGISD